MTEIAYQPWAPTKPPEAYDDEEVRKTSLYQRLQNNLTLPGQELPESCILTLARTAIREMWSAIQTTQFSKPIKAVFEAFAERGMDVGTQVTINNDGTYEPVKVTGRQRFSAAKYALFIGQGTPKDSPLYRECVTALKENLGLDESVLHGGFLHLKTGSRNDGRRNGVFELVLEKGIPGNGVTDVFRAKLYQFPFTEMSVQVISFPPVSGSKENPQQTATIREITSMSQMMRNSVLETQLTPSSIFGLDKLVKPGDVAVSNDDQVEDQDAEEEMPSKPQQRQASVKSEARAMLEDDSEE